LTPTFELFVTENKSVLPGGFAELGVNPFMFASRYVLLPDDEKALA
jgi:hypothetical protein